MGDFVATGSRYFLCEASEATNWVRFDATVRFLNVFVVGLLEEAAGFCSFLLYCPSTVLAALGSSVPFGLNAYSSCVDRRLANQALDTSVIFR